LSYEPSSKNNFIPNEFPDVNNLNKNLISNMSNSQGLKVSNNINQNNNMLNNSDLGEIDLKNLHPEEYFDMNENNDNNQNNLDFKKESERDKEIEDILEDLYIEEYNPSLGLVKIDNPNYLNALIQCFAHIPELTDKMINLHSDPKIKNDLQNLKLTKRYRNLLINLFLPEKVYNMNRKSYNPNIFMNTFCEINPDFLKNGNIEIKDFIEYFVTNLHDELNTKKSGIRSSRSSSEKLNQDLQTKNENDILIDFLQNFTKNNNSLITNTLYGLIKYTFYCHQCQNPFYNYQTFYYLYFNLAQVKEYKQSRYHKDVTDLNLNDCLDFFQKSETLIGNNGLFCPTCKQQTESTCIKNIFSTKKAFILILERNIGGDNFNKCNIDFKESLNLGDYVERKKGEKNNEKFHLCGVINYVLKNEENGSYNAFIKIGKNDEWQCYDDENIYPVSFQDMKNIGYPTVLFYHKLS
jgi:ubiquitin C-terminal hydrolase